MTGGFLTGNQQVPTVWYPAVVASAHPGLPEPPSLILAPGAGAGQRHPFLVGLADALAAQGVGVMTFDFPYAAAGRRRPDPPLVLEQAWRDAVAFGRAHLLTRHLFIGGKSMGGRLATQVAALDGGVALGIDGIVCLGYPLRPPGRASARAGDHLARVGAPLLILQGTRDAFGGPDHVRAAAGSATNVQVCSIEGADHGFALPRTSTRIAGSMAAHLAELVASWARGVLAQP